MGVPREADLYSRFPRTGSGGWNETVVYSFCSARPQCPVGAGPTNNVTIDREWMPDTAEFLRVFEGKPRILRIAGMDFWRVEVD